MPLAAEVASGMPATEAGVSDFMSGLDVSAPEGFDAKEVDQAVFAGRSLVHRALSEGGVPTDRTIMLGRPDSLSTARSAFMDGWFIVDLKRLSANSPDRKRQGMEEIEGPERPVMLGEDGDLYVYRRRYGAGERPLHGFLYHRYNEDTSRVADDPFILLGYAMRLRSPTASPEPVRGEQ